MPAINLPTDFEDPWGDKLRTAINSINNAVDDINRTIQDTAFRRSNEDSYKPDRISFSAREFGVVEGAPALSTAGVASWTFDPDTRETVGVFVDVPWESFDVHVDISQPDNNTGVVIFEPDLYDLSTLGTTSAPVNNGNWDGTRVSTTEVANKTNQQLIGSYLRPPAKNPVGNDPVGPIYLTVGRGGLVSSDTYTSDVALHGVTIKKSRVKRLTAGTQTHKGLGSGVFTLANGSRLAWWREASHHLYYETVWSTIKGAWMKDDDSLDTAFTIATAPAGFDYRDGGSIVMDNGRLALLVSKRDTSITVARNAVVGKVFIYSDDNGATWTTQDVNSFVDTWFELHHIPAVMGGGDGHYIAYGMNSVPDGSPQNFAWIKTDNYGATWESNYNVLPASGTGSVSEWTVAQWGSRAYAIGRRNVEHSLAVAARSTDMVTWEYQNISTIRMGENPPVLWYDDSTNELHWVVCSRTQMTTYKMNADWYHSVIELVGDADAVWDNINAVWADESAWKRIAKIHYLIGYMQPYRHRDGRMLSIVCGEQVANTQADLLQIELGRTVDNA